MTSLYRKLSIATLLILLLSTIVGFLLANAVYYGMTKEKIDAQNVQMAEQIAQTVAYFTDDAQATTYLQSVGGMGYQLKLISQENEMFAFGTTFQKHDIGADALQTVFSGNVYHGIQQFNGKYFFIEHFSNDLQNTVGVPVTYRGETYAMFLRPDNKMLFSDMHMMLGSFLVGILIISLLGVFLMTRKLLKPITELTEATNAIARENFTYPLNVTRNDEIGELATSFQRMQQQLAHNAEARKAFISNVSHDFQSPLMNIQGYASLLQQEVEGEPLHYASIIEQESKRLSNLTKQLLLLTSLEQSSYPSQQVPIELDVQLKTIIRHHLWRAEEKDIELSYKLEPVTFIGDEELLYNAWENLIGNALKYTNSGGDVRITLENKGTTIEVAVHDSGIGLTEEQQAQVFERFYRVDTARKKDGTGLGLAIVEEIVHTHNGRIAVTSELGRGSTFTVTFHVSS